MFLTSLHLEISHYILFALTIFQQFCEVIRRAEQEIDIPPDQQFEPSATCLAVIALYGVIITRMFPGACNGL